MRHVRLAAALAAPFLLLSCVLSPGRFESSLDIRKDRSFTFSYVGEVIIPEEDKQASTAEAEDGSRPPADPAPAKETAERVAERNALIEALTKEVGYRSVEYVGNDTLRVDYLISGRLDRSFVYPLNIDGHAIVPWIAAEVRKDGTVRVMGLAFGDPEQSVGPLQQPGSTDRREGTFTLTTDATLLMHSNEEGPAPGPGTKIVWKVTPQSKGIPTAVLRF
ncbi:MAG TPA: hypothetical protein VF727_16645 [Allosphingosinicella sp.]|jgi:hypothetical protein